MHFPACYQQEVKRQMIQKTLLITGSSRDVLAARAVLSTLSGVLAVDAMSDGHTLRVHQGDRLTEIAVLSALERAGVNGASIL